MNQSAPSPWQDTTQGLILHVHLQPRAAHNRLVGLHNGSLKIALTAPPVDNAANTGLLLFLASLLRLPKSSLSLLSGAKSREKRVRISTRTPEILIQSLEQHLTRIDKKTQDG
ncbi:MAG: DUF167 family protein [Candidatus Binatia bacterium]